MASIRPIPNVGLRGVWTLIDPFLADTKPNVAYTCRGVRTMADYTGQGRNVYDDVYAPKNITQEKFNEDVANDVIIISLQSDDGSWVHVPNSYVSKFPEQGGVSYTSLLISGLLGAVPDHLDLTSLKLRFADMIKTTTGFENPQVEVIAVSPSTLISKDEADRLEEARKDRITVQYTDNAEIVRLRNQVQALETERDALVEYIKNNP